MQASGHVVQFYETDDFLAGSLAEFVRASVEAGEACAVIATKVHRERLEAYLEAEDVDIASAHASDAYICLDANETLARFMVNGAPQAGRFAEVAGGIIARAAMGGRRVRIFGEMVAVLWAEGNQAAALRLEALWNELRHMGQPFSLCCAYPMDGFAGEGCEDQFTGVCEQHVRVVPTETYSALTDSDERLRAISLLQQKARTLEVESGERRAAEARLHASENRYRRLFEASTDGILLVDPDTRAVIDANPVMADLLGYTYEQLIGRELWQIGVFADREAVSEMLRELERSHFYRQGALPLQTHDGQRRYVEFVSSRFQANGHDVIQCNLRDITEHKRLERESVAQAAQITATFEAITDGLLIFDANGRLVQLNPAARRLLMIDEDLAHYVMPTQGSSRFDVRDEHGRTLSFDEWPITRVLKGEVLAGASAVDIIIRALDGHEHQLNITGAPALGEHGQIIGAVCVMHDVTERRRLEQQVRRTLASLLQMAEALVQLPETSEAVAGQVQLANEHLVGQRLSTLAQAVLGCERAVIMAVDPETDEVRLVASAGLSAAEKQEWHHAGPLQRLEDSIESRPLALLRAGKTVVADMPLTPVAGLLAAAVGQTLNVPIRLGEQLVGVLSFGYGAHEHRYSAEEIEFAAAVAKLAALVLERDRLLHARASAEAQVLALMETNRLMNEFLGIASHELRTPLTVIRANVQLLEKTVSRLLDTAEDGPVDAALLRERLVALTTRIDQQSHRQERLVSDLLEASRIEGGRLDLHVAPADLSAIVRTSVDEQRLLNEHRCISLSLPSECDAVHVDADADRVGQVVTNFLTNALKYSASEKPICVSLVVHGDTVRVGVQDHGPGLSPDIHAQLWERFYRAPGVEVQSGSGVGLGLGLYISKTIIERLGGTIGVESAIGRGSTFWFALPIAGAVA